MLDVVISFDTTGSMYPALTEVRRKVSDLVRTLFTEVDNLRVGIIAHGDYCDERSSYITKHFQLSDDQKSLIRFIETVGKTGGGDSDECYERVLREVAAFDWRSEVKRVFILIGDADPHEVGYRYDSYRVSDDWRYLAQQLVGLGITIYPVQALDHSRGTFYKALASYSGTPHLRLHQFANVAQLLTAVVYKQVSNERLVAYGEELQSAGNLNTNLASVIDNLLNESKFAAKVITAKDTRKYTTDLEPVPPWRFQVLHVDHECSIKSFVEDHGIPYKIGRGFYELTKMEEIQEGKEVILVHRSGEMFTGARAREMLGLPYGSRGRRTKSDVPHDYTAFVQSTSVNRKLMNSTQFLYET